GIIGDDGIEGIQIGSIGIGKAFYRLQKWIKELNRRGIILAVCSKNNPEVAKLPFEKHSEMVIKLDDIAVFVANWSSKADNINYIQKILNIGFDSMVFIDDNPAEREIVRQHIPQVIVPDLPEDPALYLDYLISLNLFDTASYSLNDSIRTKQYQEEAKRKELATSITNFDDYLKSLDMVATVTNFEPSEFERIAQLTQRSNQFNLRTIRYNINDIKKIANSPYNLKYAVSLKDKFGDYGLISVVIIDIDEQDYTAKIDTWLMSCRVLKRGVEFFIHNKIMEELLKKGIKILNGEFIPTSKNNLVSNLLTELGFNKTKNENFYSIEISKFIEHKTFIKN
ncbi:MAG: HAD-IIIC family phosphatase, partial [Bacteroidia bacterium]|nr:HAD-IIIC family phosphatase [Bacteroidia bacterium]